MRSVSLLEPSGADTYAVVKTEAPAPAESVPASTTLQVGQTIGLTVTSRYNNRFHAASGVRL